MTGYICKRCGGTSPIGVGFYVGHDYSVRRSVRERITRCPCGYSRKAK